MGYTDTLQANQEPSYEAGAFENSENVQTLVEIKSINFKSYFLKYANFHVFRH